MIKSLPSLLFLHTHNSEIYLHSVLLR